MAIIIKTETYVKSDPIKNNNKFWTFELYDDNSVVTKWGRVGDPGDQKSYQFGSPGEAEKFVNSKVREKTRDGRNGEIAYQKLDVINEFSSKAKPAQVTAHSDIRQIAQNQIASDKNKETSDLIKYFVDLNIHNITTFSNNRIQYNYDKGQFQTALGLVGQSTIDSARECLEKIADCVHTQDYGNRLLELTRTYMMSIPQDIGHKRLDLHDFWSDVSKVQQQSALLDGLQASLVTAASAPKQDDSPKIEEEKVFNVELSVITDPAMIREIFDYYNHTKSTMHSCHGFRPKRMWSVRIAHMRDAFERHGSKLGTIVNGWHGTGSENCLSLLKSGFLVRPPRSAHVSGKLFGCGTYCAPLRRTDGKLIKGAGTKALAYATGGWGGSRSNRTFMFFVEMAMGKFYVPHHTTYRSIDYPVAGYDSTWAYGETMNGRNDYSGVYNDEAIVYRENQVNIKYLVEFE